MATETERVDKLVEESSYVFKATVTQLNASNEPAVRPRPGLIVAHVDEAFRASPSVGVGGLRGREVTMLLAGGAPALGDKLLLMSSRSSSASKTANTALISCGARIAMVIKSAMKRLRT